jgi:hypothetical protein
MLYNAYGVPFASTEAPQPNKLPRSNTNAVQGAALFFFCSYLSHSSAPNVSVTFLHPPRNVTSVRYGPRLAVKALKPIAAGDSLTVAYVPVEVDTPTRQERLESGWGYRCHCSVCDSAANLAPVEPVLATESVVEESRQDAEEAQVDTVLDQECVGDAL